MAGLQQKSMEAPPQDAGDVPDRPYFVNRPARDDDEEEEPEPLPLRRAEAKPLIAAEPIVPRMPITPTYRPAFVPPGPAAPAQKPADPPKTDLSGVGKGTAVIHRAFGEGVVSGIKNGLRGNIQVVVKFGSVEKTFGFPGAFYDGYLKVKE